MAVRPFVAADAEAARALWLDAGGWYRETSPVSLSDVDRVLHRLSVGRGRFSRGPDDAAWVASDGGRVTGWAYARSEADQRYAVPVVAPGAVDAGALGGLFDSVAQWFRIRRASGFLLDVPTARADLRAIAVRRGKVRWRRLVFHRPVTANDRAPAASSAVRAFRRADLPAAQKLFQARHPEPSPPPVPVPFLDLQGGVFRDPAIDLDRAVWVIGARRELLGVAGATHRRDERVGFLGPWVVSPAAIPDTVSELLASALGWLQGLGVERARTTAPAPPPEELGALVARGFVPLAESEVFELTP